MTLTIAILVVLRLYRSSRETPWLLSSSLRGARNVVAIHSADSSIQMGQPSDMHVRRARFGNIQPSGCY
jgi:hypothetical protein